MIRIVALLVVCALTRVAGAHELYWLSENYRNELLRFQLYNECIGVAIGYEFDSGLSESFAGGRGTLRRDVREKLESASIRHHESGFTAHEAQDTVVVRVMKVGDRTQVKVNFLKVLHDPVTKFDGVGETWERFHLASPDAPEDELATVVMALLGEFISEYSNANEDCVSVPFKIEEERWGAN